MQFALQIDGELLLAPGFLAPPNTDYQGYHTYIDEVMPPESPYLYGLHPNAEIGFLSTTADNLFRTIFEMQPRDAATGGGQTITREDKVSTIIIRRILLLLLITYVFLFFKKKILILETLIPVLSFYSYDIFLP